MMQSKSKKLSNEGGKLNKRVTWKHNKDQLKKSDKDDASHGSGTSATNNKFTKNLNFASIKESATALKVGATKAVKEVSKPKSVFQSWSPDSLQQLLIQHNVQVRASSYTSHQNLVRICDDAFGPQNNHLKENDYRRLYTMEEIGRMDRATRKIQNVFIERKKKKKLNEAIAAEQIYYEQLQINNFNGNEYDEGEPDHMHDYGDYDNNGYFEDFEKNYNQVDKILEMKESYCSSLKNEYAPEHQELPQHHSKDEYSFVPNDKPNPDDQLDEELLVEWRKPSWKFAKKYEQLNRPHRSGKNMDKYNWKKVTLGRHCSPGGCGEQLDLWDEGQISEFSQFGSGITNYFKFVKWCCWVMFILSCIHFPAVVFNMFGETLKSDANSVALTTLGNLGNSMKVSSIRIPSCDDNEYQFKHCEIGKDTTMQHVDFNFRQQEEIKYPLKITFQWLIFFADKDDLAIMYSCLDAVGTMFVIIAWLWLRIFEKREEDTLNRSTVDVSDYSLKVESIPPNTTERELAVHFANITGSAVAEVSLAFKNSKEIYLHFQRGRLVKDRFQCVERIRYELTMGQHKPGKRGKAAKKTLNKLMNEREKLTSTIQMRDDERIGKVNPNPKAIQAFVTFETELGFIKAMSAYQLSWIRSILCLYPKKLKFKGRKLNVSQAPEPSTLIWENIEVSRRSRLLRKCLTTSVATLAIFLSIIATFLSRNFQSKTLQSSFQPCPEGFNQLTRESQHTLVTKNVELSHCYCSKLDFNEQRSEDLCLDIIKDKVKANAMAYGAGFMVCSMNIFFTILMDRAGTFEKHPSLDKREGSNMSRVFVLKFLNTGCLVLLYNQKWLQKMVGVEFPDPQNFNVDWYETGGVSIIIVMMINILSPHIAPFSEYRKHRSKIRALEKRLTDKKETDENYKIWYTQEELNQVYLGPHFRLNDRYTQLLVTFFISWMYATSMPVMPIIGTVSFFLTYWVDKFLFCNLYRIPPKYSDGMGKTSTGLIGISIILHVCMSIWIMGPGKIFRGRSLLSEDHTITTNHQVDFKKIMLKEHIVVLEVVGILFICSYVFKRFFSAFGNKSLRCLRCLICSSGNKVKRLESMMNTVQVNYTSAKARGVIKGLASYNMLQNPKYQESFAISNEFAMSHNRLSSIRGYNTKEGDLCISSDSENGSYANL